MLSEFVVKAGTEPVLTVLILVLVEYALGDGTQKYFGVSDES